MIAHRLGTLDGCDMIIRIQDGACSVVRTTRSRPASRRTAAAPPEISEVRT
jgi:hypothetical protein